MSEKPAAGEPSPSALAGTPYCQHLGMRYEPRADAAEGEAPVDVVLRLGPHLTNKRGVVNGGALASMLDAALGCAVLAAMKPEEWCATVSLDVQFIRPGRGTELRGRGRLVKRGARQAFAQGEIRDESGEIVAAAQGVWHVWPKHPDR